MTLYLRLFSKYGLDESVKTGFYSPPNKEIAYRNIDIFFPYINSTAAYKAPAADAPVEKTIGLIKPDIVKSNRVEKIMELIKIYGLKIVSTKEIQFTTDKVSQFYKEHVGKPYFKSLVEYMTSATAIAMILEGPEAVMRWRLIMGPSDSEKAKENAPNSVRALYGTSILENAVYGSDTAIIASKDEDFFFNDGAAAKEAEELAKAEDARSSKILVEPAAGDKPANRVASVLYTCNIITIILFIVICY